MSLEILRQSVTGHRTRHAQLSAEREQTVRAPIDAAEAAGLLDREIRLAQSRPLGVFDYLGSGGFTASTFNRRCDDIFAIFAVIAPDRLKETALAALPAGGISSTERATTLARIDAELAAEAVAEEIALRAIDAATGSHEPRRLDARPDILLAPLAELEAAAKTAKPSKRAA